MIFLVDRSNVERMWPHMLPGLSRAEYPEKAGSMYSMDEILGLIINGELLGYYQESSGYAGIATVVDYPRKRLLSTFLGGKDPAFSEPINLEELDEFLIKLAKIYSADVLHMEGRRGWDKWIKPLGYDPMTVNFYKEVPK